jgi:hypothetical protein
VAALLTLPVRAETPADSLKRQCVAEFTGTSAVNGWCDCQVKSIQQQVSPRDFEIRAKVQVLVGLELETDAVEKQVTAELRGDKRAAAAWLKAARREAAVTARKCPAPQGVRHKALDSFTPWKIDDLTRECERLSRGDKTAEFCRCQSAVAKNGLSERERDSFLRTNQFDAVLSMSKEDRFKFSAFAFWDHGFRDQKAVMGLMAHLNQMSQERMRRCHIAGATLPTLGDSHARERQQLGK